MTSSSARRGLWFILATAVALPTLMAGRVGEDAAQLLASEGSSPWTFAFPRFDSFVFSDGQRDHVAALRNYGALPYWTRLDFKVAFWRPLSSVLIYFDAVLLAGSALLAHVHSILWSLMLVALVGLLLRRIVGPSLAGLALILFALDDARAIPTIWLANRNALVAAVFGVAAIVFHLKWREQHHKPSLLLSLLAMVLALLGGESALGFAAYIAAYELVAAPGTMGRRIKALAPIALASLGWLVAYKALGYGAHASTLYVDPFAQPLDWLTNLGPRLSVMFAGAIIGFPADLWMMADARAFLVIGAAALVAGFGAYLFKAGQDLTHEERRHLRWLVFGAGLSLLPATSTSPSIRLLLPASLGGCVAVAVVLRHAWEKRRAALAIAVGLGFFHLLIAPLFWIGLSYAFKLAADRGDRIQAALEADLDPSKVSDQRLINLWSDPFAMMSAPAHWRMSGAPMPRAWWTLSLAPGEHRYTRTAADTLELELANGRLLTNELEYFCRPPGSEPFSSVALEGMRAEVVDRDAEGVRRVRFIFDRSLDDPSLVLIRWDNGVMRRLPTPKVGSAFVATPADAV
jgi:hypothetical protein